MGFVEKFGLQPIARLVWSSPTLPFADIPAANRIFNGTAAAKGSIRLLGHQPRSNKFSQMSMSSAVDAELFLKKTRAEPLSLRQLPLKKWEQV